MFPCEQCHLFKHANRIENIFVEKKNHSFFLKKPGDNFLPVCRISAYCPIILNFAKVSNFGKVKPTKFPSPGNTPLLKSMVTMLK